MHLRPSGEHTHFYSLAGRNEAGHYHGDDPTHEPQEEIEYEGYFVLAQQLARVRDSVAEKLADVASFKCGGASPRICIIGSGAMGCLMGGKLTEGGLDVTLVDTWQEHVDAIKSNGLKLIGLGGERMLKVKATSDVASLGTFDIVVFSCKATCTQAVIATAKHLFHDETVAISFQDGFGNEDVMTNALGSVDNLFAGYSLEGASVESAGCVRIHTNLPAYIGEWKLCASQRCARICKIFTNAGFHTLEHADMRKKILAMSTPKA